MQVLLGIGLHAGEFSARIAVSSGPTVIIVAPEHRESSHLAGRMHAQFRFKAQSAQTKFVWKSGFRPEFLLDQPETGYLRLNSSLELQRRLWNRWINFGFHAILRQQKNLTQDFTTSIIRSGGSMRIFRRGKVDGDAETETQFYRIWESSAGRLASAKGEFALRYNRSRYRAFTMGMSGQRFVASWRQGNLSLDNSGWRYGPVLGYIYKRKMLLRVNYRFLLHLVDEESTDAASHEFQLLFGKSLRPDFTVLFHAYLYTGEFNNNSGSTATYVYAPLDSQNRVFMKLEKDLSPDLVVFTKMGYASRQLFADAASLSGWQLLGGIELQI